MKQVVQVIFFYINLVVDTIQELTVNDLDCSAL